MKLGDKVRIITHKGQLVGGNSFVETRFRKDYVPANADSYKLDGKVGYIVAQAQESPNLFFIRLADNSIVGFFEGWGSTLEEQVVYLELV